MWIALGVTNYGSSYNTTSVFDRQVDLWPGSAPPQVDPCQSNSRFLPVGDCSKLSQHILTLLILLNYSVGGPVTLTEREGQLYRIVLSDIVTIG